MGSLAFPPTLHPMVHEEPPKKLHPFFTGERLPTKPFIDDSKTLDPAAGPVESPPVALEHNGTPDPSRDTGPKSRKRRKTDSADDGAGSKTRRTRRKGTSSLDSEEIASLNSASPVPSHLPALNPGTAIVIGHPPTVEAEPFSAISAPEPLPTQSNPAPQDTPSPAQPTAAETNARPQRLVKFNPKTGTLGSPPKSSPAKNKKRGANGTSESTTARQGQKTLIACVRYGSDPEDRARIGQRISDILEKPPSAKKPPQEAVAPQVACNPKPTHPFFSGKAKKVVSTEAKAPTLQSEAPVQKPPKQVVFSSTPCSPKRARAAPANSLQFSSKSTGLKIPGATVPLWPPQGMVHLRGQPQMPQGSTQSHSFPHRKSKGYQVGVTINESILESTLRCINIPYLLRSIQLTDDHEIPPPPPELRLPSKHFESGAKLQRRVKRQLRTCQPPSRPSLLESSSEDELGHHAHPVVNKLFTMLKTSLSAYDRSDCESSSWAHKYSPQCAAEILQSGKEVLLLKEWLQNLKVDAVDTGAADSGKKNAAAVPAKKKRKRNKLDGFIVSSEDEADELDEISDAEDDWTSPGGKDGTSSKKTVIRAGDMAAKARDGRLANAVVISGPHGCGKTAAVYAIAKELGFEVFEINASSRRSGKDVLEKVGDMTRNHLVQHYGSDQKNPGEDLDEEDKTAEDIKAGKQGTMTSFFKPKAEGAKKKTTPKKSTPAHKKTTKGDGNASPKTVSHKSQKQSLILLEEVDVLYEEDRQFWATIMTLIAQSKRPFIMTCNDETLVPIASLNLHGIFRFCAPAPDVAVDAMLLVAANEGHALQRAPVEELYEMRGWDLRASLADLNYWCQIGVGDRRGGMDWFYSRWPRGSDLDERGDVVRVVSEGTYQAGMACFARDAVESCRGAVEREDELARESWEAWGVDLEGMFGMGTARRKSPSASPARSSVAALEGYGVFADSLSSADVLSAGSFGQYLEERLDPTLPGMTPRARDDYTIGRALLEAPLLVEHTPTSTLISTSTTCLAREVLRRSSEPDAQTPAPPSLEPLNEAPALARIRALLTDPPCGVTRHDMSLAFDPIALSDKPMTGASLDPSVFDRTMRLITLEVAPYVRGIVAFDEKLRKQRLRLGNLLSEGGGGGGGGVGGIGGERPGKRMRKTRAALSALEGGERATVRRERYFGAEVNGHLVLRTGGRWEGAVEEEMERRVEEARVREVCKEPAGEAEQGQEQERVEVVVGVTGEVQG